MPTDTAHRTVTVEAPLGRVLETIRDVGHQPDWVPQVLEVEVLESNPDGTPATARCRASSPIGSDSYTLAYQHSADGMSWSLVTGRLQTAQDGRYELRPLGDDRTEVSFELRISHNLPVPGFLRHRVIEGLVQSTVSGLKEHVEG